jgi:hypothetical protein
LYPERLDVHKFYKNILERRNEKSAMISHIAPLLSAISTYLGTPAASVHDERTFKVSSSNSSKLRASLAAHKLGKLTVIGTYYSSATDKIACFSLVCNEVQSILDTYIANVDEKLPPIQDEDFDDLE